MEFRIDGKWEFQFYFLNKKDLKEMCKLLIFFFYKWICQELLIYFMYLFVLFIFIKINGKNIKVRGYLQVSKRGLVLYYFLYFS